MLNICFNSFNDSLLCGLLTGIVHIQRSSDENQHSVIEDLPAASLLQTPGARADASTWCDEFGYVWLFGGEGYDDDTSCIQPKLLNDLWLFNTSRLEWNIMHSDRIRLAFSTNDDAMTELVKWEANQSGTNIAPKPRKRAASCGVPGIVFIVFGGMDSNGSSLSDTWIYLIQKARWIPLSGNGSHLVQPPAAWSTRISWCDLDALYVVGSSTGNITEMWKFSLRTLEWSSECLYLTDDVLQRPTADFISVVWNETFYLYQWQITHSDSESNSLTFSVDLQRWQSLPPAVFMNHWYDTPILWPDLNSFNGGGVASSSLTVFQQLHDCGGGNGQLCNVHQSYQIQSSTPWTEQRLHTSSWFYENKMYIFGGEVVTNDSRTLFNDLYIVQLSDNVKSSYRMLVLSVVIVLAASVLLLGLSTFCVLRYCDYRRGREKSKELRVRYMPLRDMTLYE